MAQKKKKSTTFKVVTEDGNLVKVKKPASAKKKPAKKVVKKTVKKAVSKKKSAARKAAPKKPAAPKRPASVNNPTQTQTMETVMTQTTKQFEAFFKDTNGVGREGYDAFVKSSTIFAKGFEEMFKTGMALAQESAEKQTQFLKDAMSSKTLNEFTEAQNKMAQANFDDFMSSATKISELGVKLLTEASEPINEQLNKGLKQATQSMAA